MSASKAKRERQAQYQSGQLDRNEKQNRQKKLRRKHIVITAVVLAVVLVLGTAAAMLGTGFLARRVTALTVDGHSLSGTMFSYFYFDAYQKYAQQNEMLVNEILDPDIPFDKQLYNSETKETWADFFISEAAKIAAQTYRLYDAAMEAGFTLTEADEQELASNRASLDAISTLIPSYKSGDAYLHEVYGRGCTVDGYMEYLRICMIADRYAQNYEDSLTFTAEEIESAYAAAPEDFETVSYKIFYSSVVIGNNEDGTVISDMEQSEANARRMAEESRGDMERFDELCVELSEGNKKDVYSDPSFSLRENVTLSTANKVLLDWLTDPSRQYGDTTYLQADERGYYVGFFIDSNDNNYPLANIRLLYLQAVKNADDSSDPDGMNAVRNSAKALLDSFAAGPQTVEAFTALAEDDAVYSDYVYDNYLPGDVEDSIDAWCYEQDHEPGDYAMVQGEHGYFLVWFDGYGDIYRDYLVDQQLRDAAYSAWREETVAGDDAVVHAMGVFCMSK